MATATPEQDTTTPAPEQQQLQKRKEIGDALTKRGIDEFQWRTLMSSLFPGAKSESVLMVIDYCKARKLDPMKKPCHIVPMRVKDARSGEWEWRDVVMPGIYEYRTTAMRTGNYLGHSKPDYGPTVKIFEVDAPEYCEMTMYRASPYASHQRIEFPVRVYFREVCATKTVKRNNTEIEVANDRWSKAPIQMLTKTTEAAGLREAFPDEFGGEQTAEEMDGRSMSIDAEIVTEKPIQPAQRISEMAKTAPVDSQASKLNASDTPAVVSEPQLEPETPKDAPKNVGAIKDVLTKGEAIFVVLETGYIAGTKDAELQQSIGKLRDSKQCIELICKAPKSDKFAPVIEEINVVRAEAQS